jgi:GntR family transcriptional repressor for pyruvate dehydrogenase complex
MIGKTTDIFYLTKIVLFLTYHEVPMSERFQSVKPDRKLYEAIVDQIEEMIVSGKLRPDERLPSERELADAFGVGRPTVREATKILNSRGLLEVRAGAGVFVAPSIQDSLLESLDLLVRLNQCTPEMIYEVRGVLEVAMAGFAATRADDTDLADLHAALEHMEANLHDIDTYNEGDLAFHRVVSKATHNQMFIILSEFLLKGIASVIRLVTQTRGNTASGLREHQLILGAIAAGDADRAGSAMQQHLSVSQNALKSLSAQEKSRLAGKER